MASPAPTNAVNAIIRALAAHFRSHPAVATMLGIDGKVLEEWPDLSRALTFPSVSIIAGEAVIEPHPAYIWQLFQMPRVDAEAIASGGAAITGGQVDPGAVVSGGQSTLAQVTVAYYAIGDLTVTLQVDCWARDKRTREKLANAVLQALVDDPELGAGIDLPLPDYYDETASYEMQGDNRPDSSDQAMSNHWRAIFPMLSGTKQIMAVIVPTIETLDILAQIGERPDTMTPETKTAF